MANQYSKIWDEELILKHVKVICEEMLENGQPVPTRSEWDKNKIVPSRRTIEKYTNMTFSEVLETLGYAITNKKPKRYSDLELVTLLRKYFDEYNKKPTSQDFKLNENYPDPINYQRRFDSWSKALELAGYSKCNEKYDENADILRFDSQIKKKKIYTPKMKNSEFNQGEWTKDEEEILKSLYLLIDYKEIAKLLNRSYNSVKVRANRLGLTIGQINPFSCIKGERWSEEELNILLNEYSHNPKIAELLPERNKQAITKMANKLDIKLRRGGSLVNSRYFEELTSQSAYIAGFIAADGYINEKQHFLEITLGIKDRVHLETIADELGEGIRITTNKENTSVRLKIVNHKIIDDLVKLNIVQCKTFTLKYFEEMPEYLHAHFIRGYFDGDGSVMSSTQGGRISFLGNKHFLESIREILSKNCHLKLNKLEPKGNIYDLRYHGGSALKVLDWLYYDADLFLGRKSIEYKKM